MAAANQSQERERERERERLGRSREKERDCMMRERDLRKSCPLQPGVSKYPMSSDSDGEWQPCASILISFIHLT